MLTTELLRFRVEGTRVRPFHLGHKWTPWAERAIAAYRISSGKKRDYLEKALDEIRLADGDPVITQGLTKLLEERSTFIIHSLLNPEEVRKEVFARAANAGVVRWESPEATGIFSDVAASCEASADDVRKAFQADLPGEQLLIEFRPPSSQWLIDRYNMAQAQGLLYSATSLTCRFKGSLRKVLTHVRMLQLMYSLRKSGDEYEMEIDGALSALRLTRRYGVRMARILPALCLAERFSLRANLVLRGEPHELVLDSRSGLVSHYRPNPEFDSEIERSFAKEFLGLESPWELRREEEAIDAGDEVFIPDFTFHHPSGAKVHLEIVGYWTPEYLERKLAKLSRVKDVKLLVAASTRLAFSESGFPGDVIWFKGKLKAKAVLEALQKYV